MSHLTFSASETTADGITVTTTITVPVDVRWPDVHDTAELAQMGNSHTIRRVENNRKWSNERNKDKEVPF